MKFNSISEAKEYVVFCTNKAKTIEDIDLNISYYQKIVDCTDCENSRELLLLEIDKLNKWKDSSDFKSGSYPQGIDELILELIEWRAIIYALQSVETKRKPFEESGFYWQWYVGGIYGVFSIFGKLLSKDQRDNSLRKLWKDISQIMLDDGACTRPEVDYINSVLDVKIGLFTNENSRTLLFRNKLISHNEAMPIVRWDDVDKDFSILIRMWSLLVSWSSYGLFKPFRTDEQAFIGVESMFETSEIILLKEKRQEYIKMVELWSTNYVHTGKVDAGRGAFSSLSVNVSIISEIQNA
ncbi:hypothetical protein [Aeromonas enteropelogenes]|uniref:hypothetical protein n=1 Tax=Aeromonas enteropelogenes TaxID=29489 RepID=UPI003B9EB58A